MKRASLERKRRGRPTVLVLDEIHRFNRAQQDAFLSHVECGDIVLIGSPQSAFAIPESAAKPAK